MADDAEQVEPKRSLTLWLILATIIAVGAIFAGPFLVGNNPQAQVLYGLLTTAVATGVGVWASWKYSKHADKESLTRYGLLAWRNVDALSVKVTQQIATGPASVSLLNSWLLDIDQAKLSWQDLLKEVFEVQARLEQEKEEVALEYKKRISAAANPEAKTILEDELRSKLAKLNAQAPIPIKEGVVVGCPNCNVDVDALVGPNHGDTAHAHCLNCEAIFPVHRRADGSVYANKAALRVPVTKKCPICTKDLNLKVQADRPVSFIYNCPSCTQDVQISGTVDDLRAERMKP